MTVIYGNRTVAPIIVRSGIDKPKVRSGETVAIFAQVCRLSFFNFWFDMIFTLSPKIKTPKICRNPTSFVQTICGWKKCMKFKKIYKHLYKYKIYRSSIFIFPTWHSPLGDAKDLADAVLPIIIIALWARC